MTMHIKKGDRVRVIAGNDKGTVGDVIAVDPKRDRVTVSGVNIIKRHQKERTDGSGRQVISGGILTHEAPIHASNVALVVREGGKEVATRVGYKREETKRKNGDGEVTVTRSVRVARKTGKEI